MEKKAIIDLCKIEFGKIYDQYRSYWLRSIYLWGSITSDDFDPETSDIDSVAIVDNWTDLQYEAVIKTALSEWPLGAYEASLRFITPNELNGIEKTWYLTRFIQPEVIVLDMPFWIHVAWEHFPQRMFALSQVNIQKVLAPMAQKAKDIYLPFTGKFHQKYFLKPFFRICYYLNQPDGVIQEPFSYQRLSEYKNTETNAIIAKLMEVREKNWDEKIFYKYLPDFEEFLDYIVSRYSSCVIEG